MPTQKTKHVSQAEAARREAQSRADTGEAIQEVEVYGVTITVDPRAMRDIEFVEDAMTASDENADSNTQTRALLRLMHRILGNQYQDMVAAIREQNSGYAPLEVFAQVFQTVSEAVVHPES